MQRADSCTRLYDVYFNYICVYSKNPKLTIIFLLRHLLNFPTKTHRSSIAQNRFIEFNEFSHCFQIYGNNNKLKTFLPRLVVGQEYIRIYILFFYYYNYYSVYGTQQWLIEYSVKSN